MLPFSPAYMSSGQRVPKTHLHDQANRHIWENQPLFFPAFNLLFTALSRKNSLFPHCSSCCRSQVIFVTGHVDKNTVLLVFSSQKYKQSTIPITQEVSNWSHIPGIAWMIMCGMELLKLLPCKVRNTQWISTRNYTVSVIRKDFVLQVLCKYSLIICLNRKTSHFSKSHQNTF